MSRNLFKRGLCAFGVATAMGVVITPLASATPAAAPAAPSISVEFQPIDKSLIRDSLRQVRDEADEVADRVSDLTSQSRPSDDGDRISVNDDILNDITGFDLSEIERSVRNAEEAASRAAELAEEAENSANSVIRETEDATNDVIGSVNNLADGVITESGENLIDPISLDELELDYSASIAENAVTLAHSKLGAPYVWAATGPDTFDCSGLMQWIYTTNLGVEIPRVAVDQISQGASVPIGELMPGDLVGYNEGVSHIAMYIGDGKVIHAPQSGDVVKIDDLNMMPINGTARYAQ